MLGFAANSLLCRAALGPRLAAAGGVLLLGERPTLRAAVAGAATLAGVVVATAPSLGSLTLRRAAAARRA